MPLPPMPNFFDTAQDSSTLLGPDLASVPPGASVARLINGTPPAQTMQTILLVEDNDSLRETMETLLTFLGYRVIACSNAHTASLAFLSDTHAGSVDLMLTDIEMPGRSGIELARELTALCPSLPVLIVSGSLISTDLEREMQDRCWKFVGKPFRLPALVDTLQSLLPPGGEAAT